MGVDDPKERTYYWSFTQLAANGKLILRDQEHQVSGKAWFDKQGGTYTLTSRWTNWEWFSLRFFDGEEIMLFSFPQETTRTARILKYRGATGG
jgi:predicted secreted hydrolase